MKITVNIATHKAREPLLKRSLISILNQNADIDLIRVIFNDYDPPKWFVEKELIFSRLKGIRSKEDLKAGAKFLFLEKARADEIYLTCDDDIYYPKNYVRYASDLVMITGNPIAFDGTIINEEGEISLKIAFNAGNAKPRSVNLGGTGSVALPGFLFSGFRAPKDYSDIDLAKFAQDQKIPFICPVRESEWIKPLDGHWETSIQKGSAHLEKLQKVVNESPFKLYEAPLYVFSDFGGWSIDFELYKEILSYSRGIRSLVEFGSGSASKYFELWFDFTTVESDVIFFEKAEVRNKILAPIEGGWYNLTTSDLDKIKKADAYLVDGPKGFREGILDNIEYLNPDARFFIDDCNREEDLRVAKELSNKLGRKLTLKSTGPKLFGII